MPIGAKHVCNGAGCRRLVPYNERWCDACAREHQRADRAHRGSARERGYTSRWERARLTFLGRNPLCAECLRQGRTTAARVVDHIRPHKGDPALFWDQTNWQALCDYASPWDCHGRKTALEDGGFGRPVVASTAGTDTQRASALTQSQHTKHAESQKDEERQSVSFIGTTHKDACRTPDGLRGNPEGVGGSPSLGRPDDGPAPPSHEKNVRFCTQGGHPAENPPVTPQPAGRHRG